MCLISSSPQNDCAQHKLPATNRCRKKVTISLLRPNLRTPSMQGKHLTYSSLNCLDTLVLPQRAPRRSERG